MVSLSSLLREVASCRLCEQDLPLGPRPVVQLAAPARILIIGQAPGTRVHETGLPFNDRSGDRLRDWLGVDHDMFYDAACFAIMPMGFCYPGRDPRGGDNPPRPECAPHWHDRLLAALPNVDLTLLVGRYAQKRYLAGSGKRTLTETVRAWADYGPDFLPLPHPSWRNTGWIKRNPWFEAEVLPELRRRAAALLAEA